MTVRLIDEEFLRALPRGALLINTSRGGVLNERDASRILTVRNDIRWFLTSLPESPVRTPLVSVTI